MLKVNKICKYTSLICMLLILGISGSALAMDPRAKDAIANSQSGDWQIGYAKDAMIRCDAYTQTCEVIEKNMYVIDQPMKNLPFKTKTKIVTSQNKADKETLDKDGNVLENNFDYKMFSNNRQIKFLTFGICRAQIWQ